MLDDYSHLDVMFKVKSEKYAYSVLIFSFLEPLLAYKGEHVGN